MGAASERPPLGQVAASKLALCLHQRTYEAAVALGAPLAVAIGLQAPQATTIRSFVAVRRSSSALETGVSPLVVAQTAYERLAV